MKFAANSNMTEDCISFSKKQKTFMAGPVGIDDRLVLMAKMIYTNKLDISIDYLLSISENQLYGDPSSSKEEKTIICDYIDPDTNRWSYGRIIMSDFKYLIRSGRVNSIFFTRKFKRTRLYKSNIKEIS